MYKYLRESGTHNFQIFYKKILHQKYLFFLLKRKFKSCIYSLQQEILCFSFWFGFKTQLSSNGWYENDIL